MRNSLKSILVIAMRRSRRVAAVRAAQGQDAPVDSHFGQLPIELQERIIEIVVRCGVALWPSREMLPTLLFAVLAAGNAGRYFRCEHQVARCQCGVLAAAILACLVHPPCP